MWPWMTKEKGLRGGLLNLDENLYPDGPLLYIHGPNDDSSVFFNRLNDNEKNLVNDLIGYARSRLYPEDIEPLSKRRTNWSHLMPRKNPVSKKSLTYQKNPAGGISSFINRHPFISLIGAIAVLSAIPVTIAALRGSKS
jgi:hypothetical protein